MVEQQQDRRKAKKTPPARELVALQAALWAWEHGAPESLQALMAEPGLLPAFDALLLGLRRLWEESPPPSPSAAADRLEVGGAPELARLLRDQAASATERDSQAVGIGIEALQVAQWLRQAAQEQTWAGLAARLENASRARESRGGFQVLSIADLLAQPAPRWLVEQAIPQGGFAVLYGPRGSGKSFVALDLALCIAAGIPWHGRRVLAGRVLYLAGEGRGGLGVRVDAWSRHRAGGHLAQAEASFDVIPEMPQLCDQASMARLFQTIRGPYELVLIDTLARAMAGKKENDPEDMGRAVQALDLIRQRTGGAVLVIHHSGKDVAKGARGHTALGGATDAELAIQKHGAELRISVEKQRDWEEGPSIHLALEAVQLAPGVASCCVRSRTAAEGVLLRGGQRSNLLELLQRPEYAPDGLRSGEIRAALADGERPMPKTTFWRHAKELLQDKLITKKGDRYAAAPAP